MRRWLLLLRKGAATWRRERIKSTARAARSRSAELRSRRILHGLHARRPGRLLLLLLLLRMLHLVFLNRCP